MTASMKQPLPIVLALLLLLLGTANAQSIRLRLPDTTALVGSSFLLPVYVDSSLTGRNVLSYQIQLNYTSTHLVADSLVTTGTLSAGVNPIANFGGSGMVTIAAATAAPLAGTGVLFYVRFRVISSFGGYSSNINFGSIANTFLNQGSPSLTFRNGTIMVPALPSISISPNTASLVVGDTISFSASGGRVPYSWRLSDSTRGTIQSMSPNTARFIAMTAGRARVIAVDSNGFSGQSSQDLVAHNFRMWTRDSSKLQGTELLLPIYVSSLNAWNVLAGSFEVQLANYPGLTLVGIERTGTLLAAVNQTFFSARANNVWEVSFANATAITGSGVLCYLRINIPNLYTYNYTFSVNLLDVLFNQNLTALTSLSNQTAVALPQINISPNTATIVAGESQQFTASNGFAPYSWTVSDTSLAVVSPSGLLTARKGGIVTLTATDTISARRTTGNITLYDTRVYVRDTVLISGDTLVDVAVYMDALPPGKSITALSMTFDYNNTFWKPEHVIQTGTATSSWTSATNNIGSNRFSIALAGTNPQTGAGPLFYIRFKVLPGFTVNNTTSLTNIQLVLNEGNPNFLLVNGQIRSLPCNPTATVSPAGNVSFCANQPVQLNGSSGTAYQYQWSRNGLPIAGAVNRLFTPSQSGNYTLRVSLNSSCSVVSDTVRVIINASPIAQITPYSDTLRSCFGDTVLLRALVVPGYTYQWLRNGATISGATDTLLRVIQNGTYAVRTTINGCQTTSAAQIVDFKALPTKPIITVLGSPVCASDSATLRIPATTAQIQWFNVNGAISGANDTVLRAGPGKYVVRVTGPFGCFIYADSVTIAQSTSSVQINPSGSTTFCEGGGVSLNLSQSITYVRWFRNGLLLPDTILPLQVNVSGSYTANYRLTGNACIYTTLAVQVIVTPRPNVTLDSFSAVCANSADFLLTGGLPLGGTYVGPGVVNNRFFAASLVPGTYTIKYGVLVNGCSDTASRSITILPLPGTSFPQPAGVCINAAPFALSGGLPIGGTYFGVGVTGGVFNPASAGIGTHIIAYTTQNANACRDTVFRSISVSPLPVASIVQGTQVVLCAGGSVALNASPNIGMSYVWLRNGVVLVGQTSASLAATLGGNYRVIVTNNSTQCLDTSLATIVTVNALPGASISASAATTFCAGGSVLLNAAPATGVNYVWLRNGVVVTGQTSASLTATQSGAYRVIATNTATQCFDTSAITFVTVNATPGAAIIPAGTTTFCTGGSVILNATPATGVSYIWLLNGVVLAGQTSASFTATQTGQYRVIATNTNTQCFDTSMAANVTVNAPPSAGISAAGPTTFCTGGSVVLNATPATGVSYTWLRNGVVVAGQTSASFAAIQSGAYRVIATSTSTQCFDTSAIITITVNAIPTAIITPAGATTFCAGDSVVLNASTATSLSYSWLRNGVVIIGQTGPSLSTSQAGDYRVRVENALGCFDTSALVAVAVNALPIPPLITLSASSDTLFSSAANGNQWFLNGSVIAGATSQTLLITQNGIYRALVTDGNSCNSDSSNAISVLNVGVNESFSIDLRLYPNPSNGKALISFEAPTFGAMEVEVLNALGQRVYFEQRRDAIGLQQIEINLSEAADGMYFVRVNQGTFHGLRKMLVRR